MFVEPVNLKLEIAERVPREAQRQGHDIDMTPYSDSRAWAEYAIRTLREAERAADVAGISERLHLWPDHEGAVSQVRHRTPARSRGFRELAAAVVEPGE